MSRAAEKKETARMERWIRRRRKRWSERRAWERESKGRVRAGEEGTGSVRDVMQGGGRQWE
eukprot:4255801-Pleurochrysis_carterae.AAC.3